MSMLALVLISMSHLNKRKAGAEADPVVSGGDLAAGELVDAGIGADIEVAVARIDGEGPDRGIREPVDAAGDIGPGLAGVGALENMPLTGAARGPAGDRENGVAIGRIDDDLLDRGARHKRRRSAARPGNAIVLGNVNLGAVGDVNRAGIDSVGWIGGQVIE